MSTRAEREAAAGLNRQHQAVLTALLARPENSVCADCKSKDPRWASWNLGVFMCIECSGVHRSVGTHISKVKSVNLDTWTTEQVENMQRWGNTRANAFWEAYLPPTTKAASMGLNAFIRAKYERREWAPKGPVPVPPLPGDDGGEGAADGEQPKKKKGEKKHKKASSESVAPSAASAAVAAAEPVSRAAVQVPRPATTRSQVGILLADVDSPSPSSDLLDLGAAAVTAGASRSASAPVAARTMSASSAPGRVEDSLEDMFHGLTVAPALAPAAASSAPAAAGDLADLSLGPAPAQAPPRKTAMTKENILSLYMPTAGASAYAAGRIGTPPVFASARAAVPPQFRPSLGPRVDTPPVFASATAMPPSFMPPAPAGLPGVSGRPHGWA